MASSANEFDNNSNYSDNLSLSLKRENASSYGGIYSHFNEDSLHYQNYGSRHKILNSLINNEFFVIATGDYERCTGDMCFVKINGRSSDLEYTNEISGNFLITRIEHEFTLSSYKQTIGLSR